MLIKKNRFTNSASLTIEKTEAMKNNRALFDSLNRHECHSINHAIKIHANFKFSVCKNYPPINATRYVLNYCTQRGIMKLTSRRGKL